MADDTNRGKIVTIYNTCFCSWFCTWACNVFLIQAMKVGFHLLLLLAYHFVATIPLMVLRN